MYSEDIIGRVRDSVDIVDLVSGYVSLKKTGKNHTGLCPFHAEKTPSFSVNPDKQIFHCFGCGAGGDVFKFIELQEGLNFPDAVRALAGRAGISLPTDSRSHGQDKKSEDERKVLLKIIADAVEYFKKELEGPAGSAARAYLQKRGVTDAIVQEFALGYAKPEWDGLLRHLKQKGHAFGQMEKAGLIVKRSDGEGYYDRFRGRIIFPIRDIAGKVIAFGGRVMDDSLPKYLNSSETPLYSKSNTLYCLDMAKELGRRQGYFIIVEGYLDAIACHQYGVRNAVATLGTALTEGHLRLMRRFSDKLVLIFDPDPAGVKASLRGSDLFMTSGMKVNVVSLPDGDDPDTFLQKHGHDAFAACLRKSVKFMDFVLGQVLKSGSLASIDDKVQKAEEMLGFIAKIPSGIERDHYIRKTAEALDLNETVLRQEIPTHTRRAASASGGAKGSVPVPAWRHRPKAEEILIHLMLKDDEIARSLKEQIQPQDFTDPLFQRVVQRILDALEKTGRLDMGTLIQDGDEEINSVISHYSVLEMNYHDPHKHCQDCVDIIKQQNHARKMKALITAIKNAEVLGDNAELARLIEEQNRLSRKPGRRIPGL
ncbi:MAG TPA: DNA primase [Nitrospirota bacterium]|nr:DNA primase [Nitrospirota bacterium]